MARGWRATATLLSSTRGPRRLLSTAAEKAEGGCCAIKQKQEKKQPETPFWRDAESWKRSRHNTLRCLAGCSLGDFSMLFYLQTHHPEFPGGMAGVAAAAMVSGVLTSLALETVVLSLGAMRMPLRRAAALPWLRKNLIVFTKIIRDIFGCPTLRSRRRRHARYAQPLSQ